MLFVSRFLLLPKGWVVKLIIFFLISFLFFSELFQSIFGLENYVDEIVLFSLCFFGLFIGGGVRRFSIYFLPFLVLFLLCFFVSLFNYSGDLYRIAIQNTINFKLFFLWVGLFYSIRLSGLSAHKTIFYFWWISLIGFCLNAYFSISFFDFFDMSLIQERYGLIRMQGFQLKPNDLAIFMAIFCFYLTSIRFSGRISIYKYLFYLIVSFLIVLFTGSRLGLFGIFLSLLTIMKGFRLPSLFGVMLLFCVAGFFVLSYFGQQIINSTISDFSHFYNIDDTKYIRVIMLYYGFWLALEYFPIGVGAGNYGTALSKDSQVYSDLGISHLEFFKDFWGVFDSNLASLLGEYGFILSILIILAYFRLILASDSMFCAAASSRIYSIENTLIFLFSVLILLTNPLFMHHYSSMCIYLYLAARGQNRCHENFTST